MITLKIISDGDRCANLDEIKTALSLISPNESLALDFQAEAPCIKHIGLEDVVTEWCDRTNRRTDNIFLVNYPNPISDSVFKNIFAGVSHFIWYSDRYKIDKPIKSDHSYMAGLFVGRRTEERRRALIDCRCVIGDRLLSSTMSDVDYGLDWTTSIDGHRSRDQYDPNQNTNKDLLAYYHLFDIEMILETYCQGSTFFPTEKTIRPIMAGKPFLAYAPKNFLHNLKKLGFKTFGSIWDEDYDHYDGEQRWLMIVDVLKYLADQDPKAFAESYHHIVQHNHKRLLELADQWRPS